jgi:hypothetical protein
MLFAGLGSGTALAANKKLVEGTVYDTTCVTVCQPACPPPPHCGPIPEPRSRNAAICARASIVCPLYRIAPGGSIYTGEGSLINVRKQGSATVLARLPIVEGHFKIRLAPGQYIFHPYMAEEQCWSAEPWRVEVTPREQSPIATSLGATNNCVVHADAKQG